MAWKLKPHRFRGDFGRTKSRKVPGYVGIAHHGMPITPGARGLQAPDLHASTRPSAPYYSTPSLPHRVLQHLEQMGPERVWRLIAPKIHYLQRWHNAALVGSFAGLTNAINVGYLYMMSDPDRRLDPYERVTPDVRWGHFLHGSMAGMIPGEQIPPRAPAWTAEEAQAWATDPGRLSALRAMMWADLWLASDWLAANAEEYERRGMYGTPEDPYMADPRLMIPPGEARVPLEPGMFRNPHVYHRSRKRIKSLDPRTMRFGDYGPGFYFSEEPVDEDIYGRLLYEADVDLERPLDVEGAPPEEVRRVVRALDVEDYILPGEGPPLIQAMGLAQSAWASGVGYEPSEVIRILERLGYDGIVVPSKGYWVAFRPRQAKGFGVRS